ncbi:ABC-type sugar transport system permease subunit [Sinorhizobium medicae]
MMLRNRRNEGLFGLALVAHFVAIYGLVFVYPTIKLFMTSFTDAPLDWRWKLRRVRQLRTPSF